MNSEIWSTFFFIFEINFLGYHYLGGPITFEKPRSHSKLKESFYEAGRELGYDIVDSNGARQTGKKYAWKKKLFMTF